LTAERRGGSEPRRVLVTQRVLVGSATGEARDALAQDWADWLTRHGLVPIPVPNSIEDPEAFAAAVGAEALILTGGGDVSDRDVSAGGELARASIADLSPTERRDRTESLLLTAALREDWPVLAVCRGMQFVNRFFGGSLRRGVTGDSTDQPRRAGQASAAGHTKPGGRHEVVFRASGVPMALAGCDQRAVVNSFHDHGVSVHDVASPLVAFADSPDGLAEGIAHRTAAIVGVQWHPERDQDHPWSTPLLNVLLKGALA
jgi:N5-(cytidine 5'-diphosphoramidyl)-L-glutamine hydrolase